MKKLLLFITSISVALLISSCEDELASFDHNSFIEEIASTRGNYDNGYVEWDGVASMACVVGGNTRYLSVPWLSGSSNSQGIPEEWIDQNYNSSNASQRMYSHVNGWEMVYSNLNVSTQSNKYFALYNKYTGIMRVFFYEITSAPGTGTSNTSALVHVTNTSLLNFTFSEPKAMDVEQTYTNYAYVPKGNLGQNQLSGVPYKGEQWYGIEFECAYDSSISGSTIAMKLNGANVTYSNLNASGIGSTAGNISTSYSTSSSSTYNISLSFGGSNPVSVNNYYTDGASTVASNIANNSSNSFFSSLWNKLKTDVPSIASSGIQAGITSLFSKGASTLVNVAGKLLNSILGLGTSTTIKSSLSDVKLNSNYSFDVSGTSTTNFSGWGEISAMPLPGNGVTSNLYNTPLGVWNISTTPKVKVNLRSDSYFTGNDPSLGVGDPVMGGNSPMYVIGTVPYNWTTSYTIVLQSFNIVVNPTLLNDFTLENIHKELVFTNGLTNVNTMTVYGLNNNLQLYSNGSSFNTVSASETKPYIIKADYDPETSFDPTWNSKIAQANNNMYCRVSFELRSKTSSLRIGYSKYFKVVAESGTHTHMDHFIN